MSSRHTIGILASALLTGSACARPAENPVPDPRTDPITAELAPIPPASATGDYAPDLSAAPVAVGATAATSAGPSGARPDEGPEGAATAQAANDLPAEAESEPSVAIERDLDERPPRPRGDHAPAEAPTTSVNPNQPAIEVEAGAGPQGSQSISPYVDFSYKGKPLFIENDPLETSGVPICVVFIRGLRECWPMQDPEVREVVGDLLAEVVNSARSLKRPFVRERACEMGWDFATRLLAPKCPGAFPAEKPPTAASE